MLIIFSTREGTVSKGWKNTSLHAKNINLHLVLVIRDGFVSFFPTFRYLCKPTLAYSSESLFSTSCCFLLPSQTSFYISSLSDPFQMFGDLILTSSLNREILDSQKRATNFASTSAGISPWLLRFSHLLISVLAFFFFLSYFFNFLKPQFSDLSLFHNKNKILKKKKTNNPNHPTNKQKKSI